MPADERLLEIRLRLQGGKVVQAETRAAAAAVGELSAATQLAGVRAETAATKLTLFDRGVAKVKARMFLLYAGAVATVYEFGKLGFEFDKAEEHGVNAFTNLLGSAAAARREVGALVALTHTTGIDLGLLTDAAQRMLAFGFSVRDTNTYLRTFGIFTQRFNLPLDSISSFETVFARIRDQGQLTGRVLLQLLRLNVPALKILREQLGLTDQQILSLRKGKLVIPANVALPALSKGMLALSAGQKRGWREILGQARSYAMQLTGIIDKPLFNWAQTRAVPKLTEMLKRATEGFESGGTRGMFLGLDPSGTLLAAWTSLANLVHAGVSAVQIAWGVFKAGAPILGGAASLLRGVAGHTTAVKWALIGLIGYLTIAKIETKAWAFWTLVQSGRLTEMAASTWIARTAVAAYEFWVLRAEYATALWAFTSGVLTKALGPLRAVIALLTGEMASLDAALLADPIVLLVVAAVAAGVAFGVLYWKVKRFHDWVNAHWPYLAALFLGPFTPFAELVIFISRNLDLLGRGFAQLGSWISYPFVAAFDAIRSAWSSTVGFIVSRIEWVVGKLEWVVQKLAWVKAHVPGGGGGGFHIPGLPSLPSFIPHIPGLPNIPGVPGLASGGTLLTSGLVRVGEHGPELLHLPAASRVEPLDRRGAFDMRQLLTILVRASDVIIDGSKVGEIVWTAELAGGEAA